mmetsp:Transcript_1351/g.1832  ORF Transcript_1351/g.1832 Transcript_1351/m.1832 type:complete len:273 (+) Transcript_1351:39-857(+)
MGSFTPLLAPQQSRGVAGGVLALAALALVGVVALVSGGAHRSILDFSQVDVNCDGSVDITTMAVGMPCAAGIMPTTMSYTSYAPYVMPPPTVMAPPPQQWGAMPVPIGPNSYAYPTVWAGDHVLSGGQAEWAEEDAAQHALNLDNWRIKILKSKKQQALISGDIQDIAGTSTDTSRHTHRHRHSHSSAPNNAQLRQTTHEDSEQDQLDDIKKSLATLAGDTTKAIGALANEMDKEGKSTPQERSETQSLRRGTDEQIDTIMKQLSDLTYAQN